MALSALADAVAASDHDLISTDLFDTVLLRDHTIESDRLAVASRRAATRLGIDATVLTQLRWSVHDIAYRAVAMERPEGEASLQAMCRTMAAALGFDEHAAQILRETEVDVDIEHLRVNHALVDILGSAARSGTRVIVVSDTYYGEADLRRMLDVLVGTHPFAAVHASADVGLTKHSGRLFPEVARREGLDGSRILHVGDNAEVDVRTAQESSWTAIHLPRDARYRARKLVGKVRSLPIKMRRSR